MNVNRESFGAVLVSGVALAVDSVILYTLVTSARWHYLNAASVSFISGAIVAWYLSVRFVFRFRRLQSVGAEFLMFIMVGLLGLILNALVIYSTIEFLSYSYLVGKVFAAVVTFSVCFSLRKALLFSKLRRLPSVSTEK